jgi:hypothetical protein
MTPSASEVSGQQGPLAVLKRLSQAGLELFESQPTLSSTVEAWVTQKLERNDDGDFLDQAGTATLISNQQVVQLLAAALTTLLNGMAAGTAGSFLTDNQMNAFRDLGASLSRIMQACKEIWVEERSRKDKQERQKVAQQVAASGVSRHLIILQSNCSALNPAGKPRQKSNFLSVQARQLCHPPGTS